MLKNIRIISKSLFRVNDSKNLNLWTLNKRLMSSVSQRVNVEVAQGVLCGVKDKLPNGNDFYTFKGVPYAKPPVGKLRFQPPVPLEKFNSPIVDCSVERDVCFHKDAFINELVGSEDCLHLNIYTPKLKGEKPLPVMLFIHGGAFMFGSGNSDHYSPEYLIQEDVIVVTINYRLGPSGFLCLPEAGVHGNAGLKDQLMALKWVKQNIEKFNGDPNNVTLFGESAGAASVHLHVLSPMSRKYFHKAICQSGVSTMEWVMQLYAEEKARMIAKCNGYTGNSDKEALETLLKATPLDVYKYSLNTLTDDEKRRGLPMPFKPVIERENAPDAIVTKTPLSVVKTPNSIDIPMMFGLNNMEGIIMLIDGIKKLELYDNDISRMIPRSVNLSPGSSSSIAVGDQIKEFYFKDQPIDKKSILDLAHLMTDYHFGILANVYAELHSKFQHNSPLYYFNFSFDGELNMYKKLFQFDLPGACHADELFYLFIMKMAEVEVAPESATAKVRKNMCKMWTNFAKYSNPTPPEDESLPFKWDPVPKIDPSNKNFDLHYLDIDEECKMKMNPDKERIDFWRGVYKVWNEDFLKPKL